MKSELKSKLRYLAELVKSVIWGIPVIDISGKLFLSTRRGPRPLKREDLGNRIPMQSHLEKVEKNPGK